MTELMLIVPHPDDEVFGLGGTLIRTAARGGRTALMTLTRGRGGRSLGLCAPAELGDLREAELRASAEDLGVGELVLRDHHDYVPDDDRGIAADEGLQALPAEALAGEIAAELDRLRPRAIVTFPRNGSNGHPDHVTTSLRVHQALARASHRPERIWHYAAEQPYDGPARRGFLAPEAIRADHVAPSHRIELSEAELAGKLRAMAHHRSQALSVLNFMERFTERIFVETFAEVDAEGRPRVDEGSPRTVEGL